ncbi:host attachment protein [Uliginosibacterium sp. 31-16]|uniref:host attachment protein n=1 Tax=Uliginosibacterium sp. 31-16 TaxID=3068315 RepID=UPI00273FC5DE|nr:host attachment protein [Uliginosibacterium sp. 31-16]MDP5241252.1 host attachment protein [Uliginosibacterium sp. 31-16]
MSITWIVVANARHARIFAQNGPNKALELVQESALDEDATAMPESVGRASPRRGQPERNGARSFAHQIGSELCSGRSRGRFSRAILVAPPAFMGMLNAELDAPTASLVSSRLDKDYTRSQTQELSGHLSQCLCI